MSLQYTEIRKKLPAYPLFSLLLYPYNTFPSLSYHPLTLCPYPLTLPPLLIIGNVPPIYRNNQGAPCLPLDVMGSISHKDHIAVGVAVQCYTDSDSGSGSNNCNNSSGDCSSGSGDDNSNGGTNSDNNRSGGSNDSIDEVNHSNNEKSNFLLEKSTENNNANNNDNNKNYDEKKWHKIFSSDLNSTKNYEIINNIKVDKMSIIGIGVDIEKCINKAAIQISRKLLTENERGNLGLLEGISREEEVLLIFSFKV